MHSPSIPRSTACGRTGIVGLGSDFGDDGLGWWVVDRLRKAVGDRPANGFRLTCASTPADLLGSIEGIQKLVVIDACHGCDEHGNILRLKWPTPLISKLRHRFGHNLTLDDVLNLATKLGQLPQVCEIWCIEGRQFEFGQPLSPEVESAARQLVEEIVDRLRTNRMGAVHEPSY